MQRRHHRYNSGSESCDYFFIISEDACEMIGLYVQVNILVQRWRVDVLLYRIK